MPDCQIVTRVTGTDPPMNQNRYRFRQIKDPGESIRSIHPGPSIANEPQLFPSSATYQYTTSRSNVKSFFTISSPMPRSIHNSLISLLLLSHVHTLPTCHGCPHPRHLPRTSAIIARATRTLTRDNLCTTQHRLKGRGRPHPRLPQHNPTPPKGPRVPSPATPPPDPAPRPCIHFGILLLLPHANATFPHRAPPP